MKIGVELREGDFKNIYTLCVARKVMGMEYPRSNVVYQAITGFEKGTDIEEDSARKILHGEGCF